MVDRLSVPRQPRLAILGSSITALAVARNASDLGLRPTILGAWNDAAFSTRRAEFREIDPDAPTAALETLRELATRGDTLLIATSDRWLRFIIAHRAALQEHFIDILHSADTALEICLDKERFSRWCMAQGLPTPSAYDADALRRDATGARFPLLLRPIKSTHSAGT
ncbi:MAG: hypothetical protein ABIS29_05725, partial [Vicinamibacterales bacterium]